MTAAPSSTLRAAFERALKQSAAHVALANDDAMLTKKAERVSKWTIAQHLEHIALVNQGILSRIETAAAAPTEQGSGRVSLLGCIVLWTGTIPRGRGTAPEATVPQAGTPAEIRQKIAAMRENVAALEAKLGTLEAATGRSPHPALGMFTAAHWVRFIPIHNHHHDKIIDEIRRA
jgi:hypothetical protein